MSGEDLLTLIVNDDLTMENGVHLKQHVNFMHDKYSYTPLMNAIHYKHKSAIRVLLSLGADPTIKVKVRLR